MTSVWHRILRAILGLNCRAVGRSRASERLLIRVPPWVALGVVPLRWLLRLVVLGDCSTLGGSG